MKGVANKDSQHRTNNGISKEEGMQLSVNTTNLNELTIDTIGHAQGIGNKMIVLYSPCPFLWFLINFLRRKIVLWLFSDRCSDFSSSCCSL